MTRPSTYHSPRKGISMRQHFQVILTLWIILIALVGTGMVGCTPTQQVTPPENTLAAPEAASETPVPTATETPSPVPTATDTSTPSTTPTDIPTLTPTETQTSTPMPTETPTPIIGAVIPTTMPILSGPGKQYAFLASFMQGMFIEVVGKDESGAWAVVLMPDQSLGWVETSILTPTIMTETLLVYDDPPTPTIGPTPTPSPLLTSAHYYEPYLHYEIVTFTGLKPYESVTFVCRDADGKEINLSNKASYQANSNGGIGMRITFKYEYAYPLTLIFTRANGEVYSIRIRSGQPTP